MLNFLDFHILKKWSFELQVVPVTHIAIHFVHLATMTSGLPEIS